MTSTSVARTVGLAEQEADRAAPALVGFFRIMEIWGAGNDEAPQSIRKLTEAPATWKQVLNLPPEPSASPQPTNRNCIGCFRF